MPIGFNPLLIGEAAPPSSRHGLPCLLFPLFQSPSHRGGGAAYASVARRSRQDSSFNPLLIGEAAPPVSTKQNASKIYSFVSIPFSSGRRRRRLPIHSRTVSSSLFQSPSHRGGGAANGNLSIVEYKAVAPVSIPFSSGRRRRPTTWGTHLGGRMWFQSPSHRGGGAARKSQKPAQQ